MAATQRCIHCEQLLNPEDELICSRCRERAANQAVLAIPRSNAPKLAATSWARAWSTSSQISSEREGIRGRELSVAISGAAEALDQRSDMLLAQEDADPT